MLSENEAPHNLQSPSSVRWVSQWLLMAAGSARRAAPQALHVSGLRSTCRRKKERYSSSVVSLLSEELCC